MNIPFWIKDPSILINKEYLTELWPTEGMTKNQKLNAISRLIILLTIISLLITQTFKILITGIITLAIIVILYFVQGKSNLKETTEGFEDGTYIKNNFTTPNKQTPIMNVLLTEYEDNPDRLPAAPAFNQGVEQQINETTQDFVASQFSNSAPNEETNTEDIKDRLFRDLGDNFMFDQSMRNFYATPNTQIPNDQGAFANYCYGDMISCKEGNEVACSRNNPRWTNN